MTTAVDIENAAYKAARECAIDAGQWRLGVFKGAATAAAEGVRDVTWIYARPFDPGTLFWAKTICRVCGKNPRFFKVNNKNQIAGVENKAVERCEPCETRLAARRPCDWCGGAHDPERLENGRCASCRAAAEERRARDERLAATQAGEERHYQDALTAFRSAQVPAGTPGTEHCRECGGWITDFDYDRNALPGYHFNCA